MTDAAPRRRLFIDWARGLAVLCMIEHHHFDAFMPAAFHGSALDRLFRFLGGVAAPTFLFLGGLSLVLMMEGRLARTGSRLQAASGAAVHGCWIFAGAYAFRFQEWALAFGASPASTMLRIDVLNCIGIALLVTALLWAAGRSRVGRGALLLAATLVVMFLSPPIWHADLSGWPPHLGDYLNGRSPRALFPLFPWAGYAFAGGALGLLFAQVKEAADKGRAEGRLIAALTLGSVAVWFGVKLLDAQPFQLYAQSDWWFDSPAYFALRCCSEIWLVAACWVIERFVKRAGALSKLGQHSLIVYWVHVELVYGRWTWRQRGTLSLSEAALALLILISAMVVLSYLIEPARRRLGSRLAPLTSP